MFKAQFQEKARQQNILPWQEEIIAQIEAAKVEALLTPDYDSMIKRQHTLLQLIAKTHDAQYFREFLDIEDNLEKIRISVYSLTEYRFVLEYLGYDEKEIVQALAHENAHANEAEGLYVARFVYLLHLSQSAGAGQPFTGHPSVRVFFPDDWTEEEKLLAHRQILLAPVKHGLDLSDADAQALMLRSITFDPFPS